jgi:hypothetical protein
MVRVRCATLTTNDEAEARTQSELCARREGRIIGAGFADGLQMRVFVLPWER